VTARPEPRDDCASRLPQYPLNMWLIFIDQSVPEPPRRCSRPVQLAQYPRARQAGNSSINHLFALIKYVFVGMRIGGIVAVFD
jgi:hypothetical protein